MCFQPQLITSIYSALKLPKTLKNFKKNGYMHTSRLARYFKKKTGKNRLKPVKSGFFQTVTFFTFFFFIKNK